MRLYQTLCVAFCAATDPMPHTHTHHGVTNAHFMRLLLCCRRHLCCSAAVCLAGYGIQAGSTQCTLCPYGTYQPGGSTTCQACPQTSFYSPVDGNGTTWISDGTTTYPGSFGEETCVPKQSQLSPEAGQAYFSPSVASSLLSTASQPSLDACLSSCPANSCCMAQYDAAGEACGTVTLTPAASDANSGMQLVYKLPPSTLGSASSVTKAKMMSSGYYAHCTIPATDSATWQDAGSALSSDARTFVQGSPTWTTASSAECKKACDNSNVCFGFLFDAAAGKCMYRGGVDSLKTRSFFVLPDTELAQFKW